MGQSRTTIVTEIGHRGVKIVCILLVTGTRGKRVYPILDIESQ